MRRRYRSFVEAMGAPVRGGHPGDFTTSARMLPIAGLGIVLGVIGAFLAWLLLKLIAVFTNLFFFLRLSARDVEPADANIGLWVLLIPVVGGLIIGLMARYGSERIRGHGIRKRSRRY